MVLFQIRPALERDLSSLGSVYRSAIMAIGEERYSPEQVAAWASYPDDETEFKRWIQDALTFVAIMDNSGPIGFGGLEKTGRISSLFVLPEYMRKGIASAFLKRLMLEGQSKDLRELTTQASEFSKPLFEKFGFEFLNIEYTTFKGVDFTRYAMRKCTY